MKKILSLILMAMMPATALADGWVLWSNYFDISDANLMPATWQIETAYPFFQLCYAKAQDEIKAEEIFFSESKKNGSIKDFKTSREDTLILIFSYDGRTLAKKYLCLPDNIDPRPNPQK